MRSIQLNEACYNRRCDLVDEGYFSYYVCPLIYRQLLRLTAY